LFDSACICAAVASAAAMDERAVSSAWEMIAAASASLSRLVWSTNHRGGALFALELRDALAGLA
jgi:hypothetical protein